MPEPEPFETAALAAASQLAEEGLDAITFDAVSARVGVPVDALQAQWPSTEDLVFAAARRDMELLLPVPDTGSFRDDLRVIVHTYVAYWSTSGGRGPILYRRLTASGAKDPELQERIRRHVMAPRRERLIARIQQAMDLEQIAAGTDPALVIDVIQGVFRHRLTVTHDPITAELADALTDALLDGVSAGGSET